MWCAAGSFCSASVRDPTEGHPRFAAWSTAPEGKLRGDLLLKVGPWDADHPVMPAYMPAPAGRIYVKADLLAWLTGLSATG